MSIHRARNSLACALSLVVAIGLIGGTAAHAAANPLDQDPSTTAGRWHTSEEREQAPAERLAPVSPNRLFSAAAAPANDMLANATKVSSLPFEVSGQPYAGSTLEADEPSTCRTTDPDVTEYFTEGDRSIWYSYTSPVAQTLSFGGGVNGQDSMVIAYAAASVSELTRISCTETSFRDENHLQAKAGATFFFQVTGRADDAASTGTASLWIRASAPISNLSPETATQVSVPGSVSGSIAKVDNNWSDYATSCDRGYATMLGTRWYKYVATSTTGVRVDLRDSYYDADAAIWASNGSVPTSPVTCPAQVEADPSGPGPYDKTKAYADFAVEPGKTYFIQVGGWNFSVGDYVMKLSTYQLPLLTLMPTPKITGTAQVGSTLTVNPGTWDEGTTLTYQWMRNGGSYISGAKSSTYTVSPADAGAQISVAVTASKPGYSGARKTSAPTAVVAKGVLTSATPTISGAPSVGKTVTAVPGAWGPSPVTYTYQWLRGGASISGATSATYTPVAADAGTRLSVTVTGTKSGYTTKAATSTATVVAKGTLTGATPTITGTTKVGSTLTAHAGTWAPAPVTLSHQWLRNGVAISGATATTYKLTATDKGKRITVRVTGTKAGYTTLSQTSTATAAMG